MRTKTASELVKTGRALLDWMKRMRMPIETKKLMAEFEVATNTAEAELIEKRPGSIVVVEVPEEGRRITVTVERGDRYLSRIGFESAGVNAKVIDWYEVDDTDEARRVLKEELAEEQFIGMGMGWCDLRPSKLKIVAATVAERVNGRPSVSAKGAGRK